MTVRTPLYNDGNDFRVGSTAQNTANQTQAIYMYSTLPSTYLFIDAGNGNIGSTVDTARNLSAATTHASSFQTPASTTIGSVTYTQVKQITGYAGGSLVDGTAAEYTDTNNNSFPIYYDDDGNIQSMTRDDFRDTYIKPAIETMVQGTNIDSASYGGGFFIGSANSSSETDATLISSTGVHLNQVQDISVLNASEIQESSNTYVNTYYRLFRVNGTDNIGSCTIPLHIESDGNIITPTETYWKNLLYTEMRHCAQSLTGHRIRYVIDTSTTYYKGSGMPDTRYSGETQNNYQAGADDYRSQFFPSGSLSTINTYYLRATLT